MDILYWWGPGVFLHVCPRLISYAAMMTEKVSRILCFWYFPQHPSLHALTFFSSFSALSSMFVRSARQQASKADALLSTAVQGGPEHVPKNAGLEVAAPFAGQVKHEVICIISPVFSSLSVLIYDFPFFYFSSCNVWRVYMYSRVTCCTVPNDAVLCLTVSYHTVPYCRAVLPCCNSRILRGCNSVQCCFGATFQKVPCFPGLKSCIWSGFCFCSFQMSLVTTAGIAFGQSMYGGIREDATGLLFIFRSLRLLLRHY